MKHGALSVLVVGLGAIAFVCGTGVADPGNGHGPPPGKGPQRTPSSEGGKPGDGGDSGNRGPGKGLCVKDCQQSQRDCNKAATGDRKSCYVQTCAPQHAAVEACRGGGGDGVTDQGAGDGVTDQGNGCKVAAQALRQCLHDCRDAFTAARAQCKQSVSGCKSNCGLPTPASTAAETPVSADTPVPPETAVPTETPTP